MRALNHKAAGLILVAALIPTYLGGYAHARATTEPKIVHIFETWKQPVCSPQLTYPKGYTHAAAVRAAKRAIPLPARPRMRIAKKAIDNRKG